MLIPDHAFIKFWEIVQSPRLFRTTLLFGLPIVLPKKVILAISNPIYKGNQQVLVKSTFQRYFWAKSWQIEIYWLKQFYLILHMKNKDDIMIPNRVDMQEVGSVGVETIDNFHYFLKAILSYTSHKNKGDSQQDRMQEGSKGQTISKANYGVLNSSKKRTKLTIMSTEDAQDSELRSFFGRIKETINCFRRKCRSQTQSLLQTQPIQ